MYLLNYPPRIVFGAGSLQQLPDYLPDSTNVLLVIGGHVRKSSDFMRITALFEPGQFHVVAGISPEPPLEEVDRLLEVGRKEKCNAVVAIGGGSVIDAAKAAAALIPLDGNTADYFFSRREISHKGLFFAAVPTTAGTGAEITKNSVLTDPESKIKQSIRHPAMTADVAIIDPELTYSASASLTAASGLDAFTQAVESFTTLKAHSVTRALARAAVAKIFGNLLTACRELDNASARLELAEGSLLSAMSFSQSGLGAVHGLAHPIGSLLHVPHGITCAILLVPILKWNMPEASEEYAELAAACGFSRDAGAFTDAVEALCVRLDIPRGFREYGLNQEHFPFIIKNCRSNSMKGNPRFMNNDDVGELLLGLS